MPKKKKEKRLVSEMQDGAYVPAFPDYVVSVSRIRSS